MKKWRCAEKRMYNTEKNKHNYFDENVQIGRSNIDCD